MISAGLLDRTIDLLSLQETGTDDQGAAVRTQVPFASNVWAGLLDLSASERIAAGQDVAQKTRVFLIRWHDDVKPGSDRTLRYEGQLYNIETVSPYPPASRQDGLRIVATRRGE